jgi:hypothetical protein
MIIEYSAHALLRAVFFYSINFHIIYWRASFKHLLVDLRIVYFLFPNGDFTGPELFRTNFALYLGHHVLHTAMWNHRSVLTMMMRRTAPVKIQLLICKRELPTICAFSRTVSIIRRIQISMSGVRSLIILYLQHPLYNNRASFKHLLVDLRIVYFLFPNGDFTGPELFRTNFSIHR